MAAKANVRTHTRRTASGTVTTVRRHTRRRRGRALVSPRHAWKLARRAAQMGRKRHRATAVMLGAAAAGELTAWLTLRGLMFLFATFAVLAMGGLALASRSSGGKL